MLAALPVRARISPPDAGRSLTRRDSMPWPRCLAQAQPPCALMRWAHWGVKRLPPCWGDSSVAIPRGDPLGIDRGLGARSRTPPLPRIDALGAPTNNAPLLPASTCESVGGEGRGRLLTAARRLGGWDRRRDCLVLTVRLACPRCCRKEVGRDTGEGRRGSGRHGRGERGAIERGRYTRAPHARAHTQSATHPQARVLTIARARSESSRCAK